MANVCSNEIYLEAGYDAISWMSDEITRITKISDHDLEIKAVMDLFSGSDGTSNLTLGSKWVHIYDFHRPTENDLNIMCESAWSCPTVMIEQITKMLTEKSPDYPVKVYGRYYEEGMGFLGVFTCDKNGYKFKQTEFPEDFYEKNDEDDFDLLELLEPIFQELERE